MDDRPVDIKKSPSRKSKKSERKERSPGNKNVIIIFIMIHVLINIIYMCDSGRSVSTRAVPHSSSGDLATELSSSQPTSKMSKV